MSACPWPHSPSTSEFTSLRLPVSLPQISPIFSSPPPRAPPNLIPARLNYSRRKTDCVESGCRRSQQSHARPSHTSTPVLPSLGFTWSRDSSHPTSHRRFSVCFLVVFFYFDQLCSRFVVPRLHRDNTERRCEMGCGNSLPTKPSQGRRVCLCVWARAREVEAPRVRR